MLKALLIISLYGLVATLIILILLGRWKAFCESRKDRITAKLIAELSDCELEEVMAEIRKRENHP